MSSGDERARTANPRLAKPVLSQLSYVPTGGRSHGAEAPARARFPNGAGAAPGLPKAKLFYHLRALLQPWAAAGRAGKLRRAGCHRAGWSAGRESPPEDPRANIWCRFGSAGPRSP